VATHHPRQVLTFLNVLTHAQPEVYIGSYHTLIDEKDALINMTTKALIDSFLSAFT
jgi:hypothetical protein